MNQVFEQTKRKHEDLLIILENKEEGLADAATSFLIEISKAGAQVANRHMRAQLRAILRFWIVPLLSVVER